MMNVSRYAAATELKFEVEFVTPCFLGGAEGNAEIRTAPFKAGLRYWWRVLYGNRYKDTELKEVEDKLFGSTERVSAVRFSIEKVENFKTDKNGFPNGKRMPVLHSGRTMQINILDYLAYGKYSYIKGSGNVYSNTHLCPGIKIRCTILLSAELNDVQKMQIKDALKAVALFGGLGSKSRNGFGSFKIQGLSQWSGKVVMSEIKPYPVVSNKMKLFLTKETFKTWEEALSAIGIFYKEARCSLEKPHSYEKRGFIARPIEAKNERIPNNIKSERLPKTFYLSVKKTDKGFQGQILSLPILFVEANKQREYESVINQMNEYFAEKMSAGSGIIREMLGGKE